MIDAVECRGMRSLRFGDRIVVRNKINDGEENHIRVVIGVTEGTEEGVLKFNTARLRITSDDEEYLDPYDTTLFDRRRFAGKVGTMSEDEVEKLMRKGFHKMFSNLSEGDISKLEHSLVEKIHESANKPPTYFSPIRGAGQVQVTI